MSSENQRGPRGQWFIGRGNGVFVPLIPVDELPTGVDLNDLPRQMTLGEVRSLGGNYVGSFGPDGYRHTLAHELNDPLSGAGSAEFSRGASGGFRFPAPQQSYNMGGDAIKTSVPTMGSGPTQSVGHHQRFSSEAQPYYPSPSHQQGFETKNELKQPSHGRYTLANGAEVTTGHPTGNESRPTPSYTPGPFTGRSHDNHDTMAKPSPPQFVEAQNMSLAPSEHTAAPASNPARPDPSKAGNTGTKGQKVYCSYWIRTGTCDYIQQGCKYLHEMPKDRHQLQEITGFNETPKWFKMAKKAGVAEPTGRIVYDQPQHGRRNGRGGAEAPESSRRGNRNGQSWRKSPQRSSAHPTGVKSSFTTGQDGWGVEPGSPKQHNLHNNGVHPRPDRNNNEDDQTSSTSEGDWLPVGRARAGRSGILRIQSKNHGPSTGGTQSAPTGNDQNTVPWREDTSRLAADENQVPKSATENTTPWGESGPERARPSTESATPKRGYGSNRTTTTPESLINHPPSERSAPNGEAQSGRADMRENGTETSASKPKNEDSPSGSSGGISLVDDPIGETVLSAYPALPPQAPSSLPPREPEENELTGSTKKSVWEGITHINGALIPPTPKFIYHFVNKPSKDDGDS